MSPVPVGSRRAALRTHYQQAKTELTELLGQLAASGEPRLPAEDELSKAFGFSRPTIRSALLALQKEGKVQRLHGVGTFVNRFALDIPANLAEDRAFVDIIADLGHEPTVEIAGMAEEPLTAAIADRLGAGAGDPACVITRVFKASGAPAVLSRDHVPSALLTADAAALDPERSTFAFIERWAGRSVRYSVAQIRPTNPGPPVTKPLGLADDAALLLLDHLHIDASDRPIAVTESYVNDDVIHFSVVRASAGV